MEWQSFLDDKLSQFILHKTQLDKFRSLKTNYERVEFLIETASFSFQNQIDSYLIKIYESIEKSKPKSNESASDLYRQTGNEHFSKNSKKQAFKYYNLALLNAPENTRAQLLAYSNRSAVFFDQNLLIECLNDIETIKVKLHVLTSNEKTSQEENYALAKKLLKRECECYIKLKQFHRIEENKLANFLQTDQFNVFYEQTKLFIKNLQNCLNSLSELRENNSLHDLDVENENKNIINELVEIKYENLKGRHCVAKRSIKQADVLFVEKAYCSILLPEFNLDYCQSCFKELFDLNENSFFYFNLECCPSCNEVFYCSKKCRNEHQNSHKYECMILQSLLHNIGIAHLAYRILNTTDVNLLMHYATFETHRGKAYFIGSDLMKIDYKSTNRGDYEQIFYLLTHENDTHYEDLFKYSLTSILLGMHFSKVKEKQKNDKEFLKSMSSLILRHLMQTICNAHAITKIADSDLSGQDHRLTFGREQIRYATAIYPRVSLLNHSCNPNVMTSFRPNTNTIVVKASRNIQQGDEIFNCYGPHFAKMNLFERQRSLLEQYQFRCECDACQRQFRANDEFSSRIGLKCLYCKSDQVFNYKNQSILCKECKKTLNYELYWKFFNRFCFEIQSLNLNEVSAECESRAIVKKIHDLLFNLRQYLFIDQNHELSAVNSKDLSINENYKIFYLDYYSKYLDILARIYCNLELFDQAALFIEKNIRLIEHLLNSKSVVELAHELFKLAEVECNCNRFEKALLDVNRAIEIGELFYARDNKVLQDFYDLKQNILILLTK